MRWFGKGSGNIEDRRGMSGGMIGGGVGIVAVILGLIFGVDPGQIMNSIGDSGAGQEQAAGKMGIPADQQGQFVSNVVESTEIVWDSLFRDCKLNCVS